MSTSSSSSKTSRSSSSAGAAVDPRPDLGPALDALLRDVIDGIPALHGLRAHEIVVVMLGAHGTSVASVRSLAGCARGVVVDGHKRRVELGLRPGFFLDGDAPRRLATLVHELLHLDPATPGALLDEHRHARTSHAVLERTARALTRELLQTAAPESLLCLAHDGEVLLRAWRHRPVEETRTRRFTDDDTYRAVVRMHTPTEARGGWW